MILMKRLISLILGSVMALPLFAFSASAATLDMGLHVDVNNNTLGDSYYLSGKSEIHGDVFGDLYVVGGQVTIDGNVHEDLIIIGGRVIVTGDVGGDIRIIGGQAAIYGNVGDDVVAAGYQLDIGKSAIIGGDVVAGVSILTIDGLVQGGVNGTAGAFLLNGIVERDVDISIQDALNLDKDSHIGGDLKYSAILEVVLDQSSVDGRVIFKEFEFKPVDFVHEFYTLVAALLLAALISIFLPRYLARFVNITRENLFKSFGVGLLSAILALVVPIVLMITFIGIPFAMIGLGAILITWFTLEVFVAAMMASYFLNFKKKLSPRKLFLVMAGMIFAYHVIGLVPYLGMLVKVLFLTTALGGLVRTEFDYWKFLKSKNII